MNEAYARDPEKFKARAKSFHKKNPRSRFAAQMWKKYRIRVAEWDAMIIAQAGRCAICSAALNPNDKGTCTDHDHETGKVREILCPKCNLYLHALEAWPHREAALEYLKKHLPPYPLRAV